MPAERFRCRREDWLRQLVRFAQALRKLDAADLSRLLVLLPARSGEIAAHHALNINHLRFVHQHGAAAQLIGIRLQRSGIFINIGSDQMIAHRVF